MLMTTLMIALYRKISGCEGSGGPGMKKTGFRFSYLFMGLVLVIMYLPILLLVIYSFNESKISSVWGGFSLKWYRDLFRDEDMFEALWNSIVLGVSSSLCAGVLGTLGALGMSKTAARPTPLWNIWPPSPS